MVGLAGAFPNRSPGFALALIVVVMPNPGLREFQAILISPFGAEIEVLIGGVHHVDSSRIAGVGVKHRTALTFVEHADPLPVHRAGIGSGIVVKRGSLVGFLGGKRHVIVKVEIGVEGEYCSR